MIESAVLQVQMDTQKTELQRHTLQLEEKVAMLQQGMGVARREFQQTGQATAQVGISDCIGFQGLPITLLQLMGSCVSCSCRCLSAGEAAGGGPAGPGAAARASPRAGATAGGPAAAGHVGRQGRCRGPGGACHCLRFSFVAGSALLGAEWGLCLRLSPGPTEQSCPYLGCI